MKKLFILLIAVGLVGCQPRASSTSETTSSSPQLPSEKNSSVVSQAKFELRDFQLDEQKQSYGGALYKGRGTLVAKDPVVSRGNYLVWLTVRQTHKNDELGRFAVFLHDGIGTVETHDYITKDDLERTKVKYVDWQVLGYMPMSPGIIVADTASDQTKQ